jgi:cytochrome d ubiquinol oxidase subunit I
MEIDQVLLARLQFGITASVHILFPCLIIGFALYLAVLEILWLKTQRDIYQIQYQFWLKPFAILFVVGAITGVVLSYQLDTFFSSFYRKTVDILLPIRELESLNTRLLIAGCFGIMIWGWRRVGSCLHLLATLLVTLGVLVSVSCILARNSWMQTPAGFAVMNGQLVITDRWAAVFSPSFPYRFAHMVGAALVSTAFIVLGISSWFLLKQRQQVFARFNLRIALAVISVAVPLQLLSGDLHGLNTRHYQPAKLAAIEALWDTTAGAPLVVFALPDQAQERNRYAVEIPKLASLILTHDPDGAITGLKAIPKDERPQVAVAFFSLRLMVGIGLLMVVVGITGLVLWHRRQVYECCWFLRLCCAMMPSGLIATIAGWWVTEAGRQPWVVYGLIKTADVVTLFPASDAIHFLSFLGLAYSALLGVAMYYFWRVIQRGPDGDESMVGNA